MADTKTSGLTELAEAPAANDLHVIVDVSDTSMAVSGTTKKILNSNFIGTGATQAAAGNHTHPATGIDFLVAQVFS